MEMEGPESHNSLTRKKTGTGVSAVEGASGSVHMDSEEGRRAKAVESEVNRVKLLPASSSYAIHRLRVLSKMLELLKIDPKARTKTEVDELELLLAGMSL